MEKLKLAVNAAIALALVGLIVFCVRLDSKAERILHKVQKVEDSFQSVDLGGVRAKIDEIFKVTKDPTAIIRRQK